MDMSKVDEQVLRKVMSKHNQWSTIYTYILRADTPEQVPS